jgi:hypothetical protein
MIRRLGLLMVAATLQLVALVLAHELVFLARYGSRFGEALVHSGHGETWSSAVTTSLILGAGLAIMAIARLAWLGILVRRRHEHARSAEPRRTPEPRRTLELRRTLEPRLLLRIWLRTGSRLSALAIILLTAQENIERTAMGAGAPGIGILLSPEYAGGLWITLAVGLAVGLVAALFEWRHRALLARLRASRVRQPRVAQGIARRPGITVALPIESILGRRSALRAPPARVAT